MTFAALGWTLGTFAASVASLTAAACLLPLAVAEIATKALRGG